MKVRMAMGDVSKRQNPDSFKAISQNQFRFVVIIREPFFQFILKL